LGYENGKVDVINFMRLTIDDRFCDIAGATNLMDLVIGIRVCDSLTGLAIFAKFFTNCQ